MDSQRSASWPRTNQKSTVGGKPRDQIPPPLPPRANRPVPPPSVKPLLPLRPALPGRPRAASEAAVPSSPTETDDWEEDWGADYDPYTDDAAPQSTDTSGAAMNKLFGSTRVVPLDEQNYDNFVKSKEKTLVMFYDPFKCESVFPGIQFGKKERPKPLSTLRPMIKPPIPERKVRPVPPPGGEPLKPLVPVYPRTAAERGAERQNICGSRQVVPLGDTNYDESTKVKEIDALQYDNTFPGHQYVQKRKPTSTLRPMILPPIPERKVRPVPPPGGDPLKPLLPVYPRTAAERGAERQNICGSRQVVPLGDTNYDESTKVKEKIDALQYDNTFPSHQFGQKERPKPLSTLRPMIKPPIPERKVRPVPPPGGEPLKPLLPVYPRAAAERAAERQNVPGSNQLVPLGDHNYDEFIKNKEKTDAIEYESLISGLQFGKKERPHISEKIRPLILPPIPERKVRPVPPPGGEPLKPLRPVHPRAVTAGAVGTGGQNIFRSRQVVTLDDQNYDDFIKGKEKTLVMFYDPFQYESVFPGLQFGKAADEGYQAHHAFAAVDCSLHDGLCCREGVKRMPMLKLYSNGFELSKMEYTNNLDATQLRMLVKMTPVLQQPMGRPPLLAPCRK